jgi:hypothetical protein
VTEALVDPRKPRELARECPIDIYLSGHDGGGEGRCYWPWPYRMDAATEALETYVRDSDVFILDSKIGDPEVTNADVLADAERLNPDYVVPADAWCDPAATTGRIEAFASELEGWDTSADMIVPLQPTAEDMANHHEHYPEVAHLGDFVALGGLKDAPAKVQRDAVENVRAVAGDDTHIHGLGFGINYFRDRRVLKAPVLDSIDCSTPIQEARNGRFWTFADGELTRREVDRPSGAFDLLQIAMAGGTTMTALARMVLAGDRNPEQSELTDHATPVTDGGSNNQQ